MKKEIHMMNMVWGVLVLLAALLLVGLILSMGLWLKGVGGVTFFRHGVYIVVGTRLLSASLVVFEIPVILLAMHLVRYLPIGRTGIRIR